MAVKWHCSQSMLGDVALRSWQIFFTPWIKFLRTNSKANGSFVGMIFESEMGFQPLAVDGLYELVAEL